MNAAVFTAAQSFAAWSVHQTWLNKWKSDNLYLKAQRLMHDETGRRAKYANELNEGEVLELCRAAREHLQKRVVNPPRHLLLLLQNAVGARQPGQAGAVGDAVYGDGALLRSVHDVPGSRPEAERLEDSEADRES